MNDLLLLSTVCLVAMVSPGPDFLLVTRNSLLYQRLHAFATAAGIIAGCLIHATYCTLGLALIITKSTLLFSMIKYAGACYLIYIGLKGLTTKSANAKKEVLKVQKQSITVRDAFIQGFLCNLLNPKLAVFLLSLFTQFISVDATMVQKATVAGIFVLESAVYWPLLVVVFQWQAVKALFEKFQVFLDRLFGALLIALGMKVALSSD